MEPKRILVVANQTAAGAHLVRLAKARLADGPCRFTILIPAQSPEGFTWTEGQARADAEQRLEEVQEFFRDEGVQVAGVVGDRRPLLAVDDYLRHEEADEIVVSTFPQGASRWIRQDLPHRIRRTFDIPVTHVVAERIPAAR